MWNNIGNLGNLTKILAEKAAAAAENIEGQLNESVGAPPEFLRESSNRLENNARNFHSFSPVDETAASEDDDDPFNEDDGFYKEDSFDVDMHDEKETEIDQQQQRNDVEAFTENVESVQPVSVHDMEPDRITKDESVQESNGDIMGLGKDTPDKKMTEQVHEKPLDTSNGIEDSNFHESNYSDELEVKEIDDLKTETSIPRNLIHMEETDDGVAEENNQFNEVVSDTTDHLKVVPDTTDHLDTMVMTQVICENERESDLMPKPKLESVDSQEEHSNLESDTQQDLEQQTLPTDLPDEDMDRQLITDQQKQKVPSESEREEKGDLDTFYTNLQGVSESNSEESIYVTKEEAIAMNPNVSFDHSLESQLNELKKQLQQREEQLASKSTQLSEIMDMHEKEKSFLEAKLKETKEEAKKRVAKAREKVDDMKAKLAEVNNRASSIGSASNEQEKIIQALRQEGEDLAKKQSEMEQLVRDARADMRNLKIELEAEKTAKQKAEENIAKLEHELKDTKAELVSAKQRLTMTDQLESDLLDAREEKEKKSSIILGLEAKLKETLLNNSQLQKEMDIALKDKVAELAKETSSIRNEKDAILQDLESKLRVSEREASLREDSLRHEVSELRKRWQEAVRRCDGKMLSLLLLSFSMNSYIGFINILLILLFLSS